MKQRSYKHRDLNEVYITETLISLSVTYHDTAPGSCQYQFDTVSSHPRSFSVVLYLTLVRIFSTTRKVLMFTLCQFYTTLFIVSSTLHFLLSVLHYTLYCQFYTTLFIVSSIVVLHLVVRAAYFPEVSSISIKVCVSIVLDIL